MRTHQEIRKELGGRLSPLLEHQADLPLRLRPYQLATLRAARAWLENPEGTRAGYVEHATGLGKTAIFAALTSVCSGLRVLLVEPSLVLIEQTARALHRFTGGMLGHLAALPVVKGEEGGTISTQGHAHKGIVLTTDESLARKTEEIAADFAPDLIIVDECHFGYTEAMLKVWPRFARSVLLGFSATPDYLTAFVRPDYQRVVLENGQELFAPPGRMARGLFGTLLDRRSLRWGIEHGWLAPLAWGKIDVGLSLDGLPVGDTEAGTDYQPMALQGLLKGAWSEITQAVCRLLVDNQYGLRNRQIFTICPTVAAAEELIEAVRHLRIKGAVVSAQTRPAQRQEIFRAYREGSIAFLASVAVLREGWDSPQAEVCLALRPTKSYALYVQGMGRTLRYQPNKVSLVLDGHFAQTAFQPLTAAALYGPMGKEARMGEILVGTGEASPYLERAPEESVSVEQLAVRKTANRYGHLWHGGQWWSHERAVLDVLGTVGWRIAALVREGTVRWMWGESAAGLNIKFYAVADVARAEKQALPPGLRPGREPEKGDAVRLDSTESADEKSAGAAGG